MKLFARWKPQAIKVQKQRRTHRLLFFKPATSSFRRSSMKQSKILAAVTKLKKRSERFTIFSRMLDKNLTRLRPVKLKLKESLQKPRLNSMPCAKNSTALSSAEAVCLTMMALTRDTFDQMQITSILHSRLTKKSYRKIVTKYPTLQT